MTKTKFTEKPAKGQMGLALNNMENCVETLTANQTTRCQLEHEGQLLLERVASEGMDERLLERPHPQRDARTPTPLHRRAPTTAKTVRRRRERHRSPKTGHARLHAGGARPILLPGPARRGGGAGTPADAQPRGDRATRRATEGLERRAETGRPTTGGRPPDRGPTGDQRRRARRRAGAGGTLPRGLCRTVPFLV